jgi:predicted N-acyltransferase
LHYPSLLCSALTSDVRIIFPGGGEFKYLRGFDPYVVSSVHWFRSPRLQAAVGDFLEEERTHNQVQWMMLLLMLIKHTGSFFSE